MSQAHTTQDLNQKSSETSSGKQTSRYKKDDSDGVMAKVKALTMKRMRDPEAEDYVETSREMVNFFAGDSDYKLDYVIVSGIKVYAEGTFKEEDETDVFKF